MFYFYSVDLEFPLCISRFGKVGIMLSFIMLVIRKIAGYPYDYTLDPKIVPLAPKRTRGNLYGN
jgi:hypothetical protein